MGKGIELMKTKTNLSSQLKLKFEQSLAIDDKISTMSSGSMDNLHVKLVSTISVNSLQVQQVNVL